LNERARAGKNQQRPAGLGARNRPVAINILAALTGSASSGMTIALDALGETCMRIAAEQGINPALMHRWPQLASVPSTACRIMVLS
jgi:H+/gluconate symporter-like permease